MKAVRAVFMGTPEFAAPTLRALVASGIEVAGVFTQPDRPAGRGRQPLASAVKQAALELGLEVFQPLRIKQPEAVEAVRGLGPEVIVVVGYGQIIPAAIFDFPPRGTINVHASLLPKYRGAAPIQWAIANGETLTGVTTMRIDAGLDTGDILLRREWPIEPEETAPQLSARLAEAGAALAIETLRGLEQGSITPRKQNQEEASYAPLLKKEDGCVDWSLPARVLSNRVRGFVPWPGVYSYYCGRLLHLRRAREAEGGGAPGRLSVEGRRLFVGCGVARLELLELQPEGKRRLSVEEFINGWRPTSEQILGEQNP